jgi:hypothetical protein
MLRAATPAVFSAEAPSSWSAPSSASTVSLPPVERCAFPVIYREIGRVAATDSHFSLDCGEHPTTFFRSYRRLD